MQASSWRVNNSDDLGLSSIGLDDLSDHIFDFIADVFCIFELVELSVILGILDGLVNDLYTDDLLGFAGNADANGANTRAS